jgi:hypothetical protein
MRPLNLSRHMGGRWWWKVLITYNLVLLGQDVSLFQNMASMIKVIQLHMAQMIRNGISDEFNSIRNGVNN